MPGAPDPEEVSVTPTSTELKLDDLTCFIAYESDPIPISDLEDACSAAWQWPDALSSVAEHRAFARLSILGEGKSTLWLHVMFTHLVAAVAQAADSLGVFWEGTNIVHDANEFQSQLDDLSERSLAPQLWVDMRVEQATDSSGRFFTTGMEKFQLLDIEIPDSKRSLEEIFEFGYSVVYYALSEQSALTDGSTIGRGSDEKFVISHQKSFRSDNKEVVSIRFE